MKAVHNVFETIQTKGNDEEFLPSPTESFAACSAPAGSSAKIAALRERLELGHPLWHDQDRVDLVGITDTGRPRRRRKSRPKRATRRRRNVG